MMGAEMVPETSAVFNQVKLVIALEDFINSRIRENLTSEIGYKLEQQD
jgi:hypothetical protein